MHVNRLLPASGVSCIFAFFLATACAGQSSRTEETKTLNPDQPALAVLRDSTPLPKGPALLLSYADAVEKVRDSVVTLRVKRLPADWEATMGRDPETHRYDLGTRAASKEPTIESSGSGIIITLDGYLLTNHHVIDKAAAIFVKLRDSEEEIPAVITGRDPASDLALLKIDAQALQAATLGDSRQLRVGDVVLALGSPFGLEQTLTMGVISATGRSDLGFMKGGIEDFLQTDAAINPGNSGGPLVDGLGRVVGVNTARFMGNSIGFAIPVNLALKVANDLIRHGFVVRGYLGIRFSQPEPDETSRSGTAKTRKHEVIVADVFAGSPADKAGFLPGDIVTEINQRRIENASRLQMMLASLAPGAETEILVLRPDGKRQIKVVLGTPPDFDKLKASRVAVAPELVPGLGILPLTGELRLKHHLIDPQIRGVIVQSDYALPDGSVLLHEGDCIAAINGTPVSSPAVAQETCKEVRGPTLMLKVIRQEKSILVALKRF